MLPEALKQPYMEEPYEIASGIFHFRKYHRVETRVEVANQQVWLLATGVPEGPMIISDSQKTNLDDFFRQAPSAIQVYLGKPKPLRFYSNAPFNIQVAIDKTRKKTGLTVGLFSGGAYFTAKGITPFEAERIHRLVFFSPVLGWNTIKPPIIKYFLTKTAAEHLEELRPVVETVSKHRGSENVIFFTGDESDQLVNGSVVVDSVYSAFGNKVTIKKDAYKGHVPSMAFLVDVFKTDVRSA